MVYEYEVKTTVVKRITVCHRVLASAKALAIDLAFHGKAKRANRDERIVEGPNHITKKVRAQ